ncbi:unnamed protein product [Rotaria socialis]
MTNHNIHTWLITTYPEKEIENLEQRLLEHLNNECVRVSQDYPSRQEEFQQRLQQLSNNYIELKDTIKQRRGHLELLGSLYQYDHDLSEPEAYVTASHQCVAQSNQWSLKELILQVIVQDSTNQQQVVEDDCTFAMRGLRLQGAQCRSNKLSLLSSISTEIKLTLFTWIRATERKQTNAIITLPVYLNATRNELLFTIELEAADNSLNEFDF